LLLVACAGAIVTGSRVPARLRPVQRWATQMRQIRQTRRLAAAEARLRRLSEEVRELPAELRVSEDTSVLVGPPVIETDAERRAREVGEAQVFATEIIRGAVLPPVLAFICWPQLSRIAQAFAVDSRYVDGANFASGVLAPTINGVVVPALAIVLGSLVATTIGTLRERLVTVRSCVNVEACELRLLRSAVYGMYGTAQHLERRSAAFRLLRSYSERIVDESREGALARLAQMELEGGVAANELEELNLMLHGISGAAASRDSSVSAAHCHISTLNEHRSRRVAALLTNYPTIHWVVLAFLAGSIFVAFGLDIERVAFASFELQLTFAVLVAACSTTAALCVDLCDPFRGSFNIKPATRQLLPLITLLDADLAAAAATGSVASPRGSWSLRDTIYFHLLTSGLASQVRALGDLFAVGEQSLGLPSGGTAGVLGGSGQRAAPGAAGPAEVLHPPKLEAQGE